MRHMVRMFVAGGLAATAAACGPKAESAPAADAGNSMAETAAARTGIDAANGLYMSYFNTGHPDSVATLFVEDGRMMPPNAPMASGRAAITAGLATMAGAKLMLALTTVSLETTGSMAVEAGTYKFSITPPGAKDPINDNGKYLAQWRKVGDKWLMVNDIWNSDVAMPMPPSKP